MSAVPEVNDDMNASSTSVENTQPPTQPEVIVETLPSSSSQPLTSTSATTIEKDDQTPTESQPSATNNRQHISRLSQFQRNTIHVCDQVSDHVTSHQQHHSAPPIHNQTTKSGLDAINENAEYNEQQQQQQQQQQQNPVNLRFPRSSTVPYPAYATVRRSGGGSQPENIAFIHGTVSPAQLNAYYSGRQPFALINTNFQPISPQHQQYGTRPVDILKPTFLIVPKAVEQRLAAQLSASSSPVPTSKSKPSPTKSITRKTDIKSTEQSPSITRHVQIQSNNQSPTITTVDTGMKHIGLIGTPNPSPYVHFVNVTYPKQPSQEALPQTTVVQDEFQNLNEYNQATNSIRSMPNISLAQVSPQHLYGSPTFRYYPFPQQPADEQQQQQQQQQILTTVETNNIRAATAPQMGQTTNGRIHMETGEIDESSVASLDFAHADFIDMPGSWRYQSIPIQAIQRRYRAPIPQAFLDQQHYLSDSEQVVRTPSYRQQQVQQQLSGSIPTINRPFDSIRSQQPIQFLPSMRLNDKDILKIAAFYKSMGTLVHVAHSLATLYTSDFDAMANLKDWKKLYTGVPIWLFNTGVNPKRARCIRLIISELGSSFTLWDTIVNGASDVRLPKARHITLKSLETGTILALKFDDVTATDEFHQYFVKLSCDPRNVDLFDVFNAKRRQRTFPVRKRKIKKSAISKPSHFNHITKVDEHDRDSLYTFSVLVDDAAFVS